MRAKLREIAEAAAFDPKKALIESLGDGINAIEVFHNQVMVATYIEPDKTPGGIIKPDRTLAENRFQGKCALVLKLGPTAFKYDGSFPYEGPVPQVGDWVIAYPSDGRELFSVDASGSAGTCCRIFEDINIKGRVSDPALIY